jgi:hypothetical protein
MRSIDRLGGSPCRRSIEQVHQARLVTITHGRFAVWLNPFGMLDPQVIVNLLPELGIGVDLVKHDNRVGQTFKCAAITLRKARRTRRSELAAQAQANSELRVRQKTARTCLRCARRMANRMNL